MDNNLVNKAIEAAIKSKGRQELFNSLRSLQMSSMSPIDIAFNEMNAAAFGSYADQDIELNPLRVSEDTINEFLEDDVELNPCGIALFKSNNNFLHTKYL